MNHFKGHTFAGLVGCLENLEQQQLGVRFFQGAGTLPLPGQVEQAKWLLGIARNECQDSGMKETVGQIDLVLQNLKPELQVTSAQVSTQMNRVKETLVKELSEHRFLFVHPDRVEFLERLDPKERTCLFGEGVAKAFHSAARDINEAGNCIAAECDTASVFHLMRAAEIALRALAKDRKVEFADKPLEQKEWGQILSKLGDVVRDMREGDGKRWSKPEFRESQIRFYSEAVQELRAFNEAWRRHISHAHADAFYDRDYAASVLRHVRAFMQKLATRISEATSMAEYWDTQ